MKKYLWQIQKRWNEKVGRKMSTVEWLQNVVEGCIKKIRGVDVEWQMHQLSNVYNEFTNEEKDYIYNLMEKQLNNKDSIFVLSIMKNYIKDERLWKNVSNFILSENFESKIGIMLEIQLRLYGELPYSILRKLHQKNIKCLENEINCNFEWISTEKRNKKSIVIITEQLLNIRHAPTHIVMEFAYILQKELQYNVEIITCTSNVCLPSQLWIDTKGYNGTKGKMFNVQYKGNCFNIYNYPLSENSAKEYREMLKKIYNWNPIFVFNMGVVNPIADFPYKFTTVVSMGMTIDCPVSEAQILLRESKRSDELEKEYLLEMRENQKQVFLEKSMPPIILREGKKYTRRELHLPNDQFAIAVVGNRLDTEVDERFAMIIKEILKENLSVIIVFIGKEIREAKKYFTDETIKERIFYMGYCEDLMRVYRTMDLYLNPPRLGGGFSAAMALEAGIPIVTLPNCDVAYYAKEDFCVDSLEEMKAVVGKYAEDNHFYTVQQRKTKNFISDNTEEEITSYITWLVDKIKNVF